MTIRNAMLCELDEIKAIYNAARQFMIDNGNKTQWEDGYPERELLESDIEKGELFVCEENGEIAAVFAFIIGEDPTYGYIEDGAWISNEPYGTLHRIASSGKYRNMGKICLDFCKSRIGHVRGDTHADNFLMQKKFEESGFVKCGIIYIADGTPRIAYEYIG